MSDSGDTEPQQGLPLNNRDPQYPILKPSADVVDLAQYSLSHKHGGIEARPRVSSIVGCHQKSPSLHCDTVFHYLCFGPKLPAASIIISISITMMGVPAVLPQQIVAALLKMLLRLRQAEWHRRKKKRGG